jgi:hypothetical protein
MFCRANRQIFNFGRQAFTNPGLDKKCDAQPRVGNPAPNKKITQTIANSHKFTAKIKLMKSPFVFLLPVMFSCSLFAQKQTYQGTIRDASNNEALAFVSIALAGSTRGTVSDLDGRFSIEAATGEVLLISFVGYRGQELQLGAEKNLRIRLQAEALELQEVVIRPKENPAWGIIRKALANRDQNDPEQYRSYQYTAHNKSFLFPQQGGKKKKRVLTEAEIEKIKKEAAENAKKSQNQPKSKPQPDSSAKKEGADMEKVVMEQMYLWMKESVVNVSYRKPNQRKELIVASKNSLPGDQSPGFAPTDFQPFGFYQEIIPLNFYQKQFVNPLSKGTFNRYDFKIRDTLYHEQDSTFVLSFKPLSGRNFEGMRGLLYINSAGYALENIIASPADTSLVFQFKIQQQYTRVNGRWFPQLLQTDLSLDVSDEYDYFYVMARNRSQISEVRIEAEIPRNTFNYAIREQTEAADSRSDSEWEKMRLDTLSKRERNSYVFWDSLPELRQPRAVLKGVNKVLQILSTGLLPLNDSWDLSITELFRRNRYEGLRLSLGVVSNFEKTPWLRLGVSAGYGFRDKAFKYGGWLETRVHRSSDLRLRVGFSQDLAEPGSTSFLSNTSKLLAQPMPRNWLRDRMDSARTLRLDLFWRPFSHWQINPFVLREQRDLTQSYDYAFRTPEDVALRSFSSLQYGLNLRWAPKEKLVKMDKLESILGRSFPVFDLQWSRTQIEQGGSADLVFEKLAFNLDHAWRSKALGMTTVRLSAGNIWGTAPYSFMYNAPGSRSPRNRPQALTPYTFQTMGLWEFTQDRYAYFFFEHNFGQLLWKSKNKRVQPELSLVQNLGYGELNNEPTRHLGAPLQSMNQGFVESGIFLRKLYRLPYSPPFNLDFGLGGFYRWGYYHQQKFGDNIAWQVIVNFGL